MNRWKKLGSFLTLFAFPLVMMVLSGCEKDPTQQDDDDQDTSIETYDIICHGLSPKPGSLDTLTVLASGYSSEFADYTWTAEGGSFVNGNKGISVKWLAPDVTGLYKVTVIGALADKADTSSRIIAVRNFNEINTGRRYSVAPKYTFNALYFYGDANNVSPRSTNWKGFFGYKYMTPGSSQLITPTGEVIGGGFDFFIPRDGSFLAGSFYRTYYVGLQKQRRDVWMFPLGIGTAENVSDDGGGTMLRKNQHLHPFSDIYCNKMVWEAHVAGPSADGTKDLVNIIYWENASDDTIHLTESHDSAQVQQGPDLVWVHRYYNNILPVLTPNLEHVIYFVDTTAAFEPCIIDMVGGVPQISTRRELDGIFDQQDVSINDETFMEWSPTLNVLAFIDRQGDLCFFDYTTESVVVSPVEKAEEFAWAPDGTEVAVISETGIWRVSAAGMVSAAPVFTRERNTDGLYGINWSRSAEDPMIAWRMVRKGKDVYSSFSALMIYYVNEGVTVYASRAVNWSTQWECDIPFSYKRMEFGPDNALYAPIPTPLSGSVESKIFKSYE